MPLSATATQPLWIASTGPPHPVPPQRRDSGVPVKLTEQAVLHLIASSDRVPPPNITTPPHLVADTFPVRYGGQGPPPRTPRTPSSPCAQPSHRQRVKTA
jgi:hypothetical protein